MGVTDRLPLQLRLTDVYVPLKARRELPLGETWECEARLAGKKLTPDEAAEIGARLGQPKPVADLLREHPGVILVGDPGAGRTTFLKYLTLRFAEGEGGEFGIGKRLPVLVPLSAYGTALATREVRLDEFTADYYRERGVDAPVRELVHEALGAGTALLLLDGLDEVRELAQREVVVKRVVDFYLAHRKAGNKFVLTSRIVGYREVRPTVEGLVECTLLDFDDEEIEAFVGTWTRAIEKTARGETRIAEGDAQREREELLDAVRRNPGVRGLAANPLLLTILALMKRQGIVLPDRRVELYAKYVEVRPRSLRRREPGA